MKTKIFLFVCGLALFLPSCSNVTKGTKENMQSEVGAGQLATPAQQAEAAGVTVEQLFTMPKEQKEMRMEAMKLFPYLEVKDGMFVLNITAKEAQKLGVSKEAYDLQVKNLASTNAFLKKAKEEGKTVEIPDLNELKKRVEAAQKQNK